MSAAENVSNVVLLSASTPSPETPAADATIVEALELLLAKARSGEMRGFAIAYASKRSAGRCWTAYQYETDGVSGTGDDLLVAVRMLNRKYETWLFDTSEYAKGTS